jgi:hypothetical protein
VTGVQTCALPISRRNKHGIPYILHTLFFLMSLLPNLLGMNIGQLAGMAVAVGLMPQLIPVWGFVTLPDRIPVEQWKQSRKISTIFATRGSRILACLIATGTFGIFVGLNVSNFSRMQTIVFIVYFVVAGIICFGFGDKILAKGAKRKAVKENA